MKKNHWQLLIAFVAGGFLFAPIWNMVRGVARRG